MAKKKTTVNLTEQNWQKIRQLNEETEISQSDLINQAVSGIPIINIGDQKSIAESFFEIRKLLAAAKNENVSQEVEMVCQYINRLMQKIAELTPSSKE